MLTRNNRVEPEQKFVLDPVRVFAILWPLLVLVQQLADSTVKLASLLGAQSKPDSAKPESSFGDVLMRSIDQLRAVGVQNFSLGFIKDERQMGLEPSRGFANGGKQGAVDRQPRRRHCVSLLDDARDHPRALDSDQPVF